MIFRWPITPEKLGNGMLRLLGLQPAGGHEMVHSVEELRLLVTGMQEAGVVEESEARIARRAFQFADLTAGALMTPRTELEAVPVDVGREELLRRVREGRHSRLVVYEGSLDDVVGVLHVRDLFAVRDRRAVRPARRWSGRSWPSRRPSRPTTCWTRCAPPGCSSRSCSTSSAARPGS